MKANQQAPLHKAGRITKDYIDELNGVTGDRKALKERKEVCETKEIKMSTTDPESDI